MISDTKKDITPCINLGVSGRYMLKRVKTETQEVVQEIPWFTNLITNVGMDAIGTGNFGYRCVVGSGTGSPAFSDTQLQVPVANTVDKSSNISGLLAGGTVLYGRQIFTFFGGSAAGNISEVGITTTNSTSNSAQVFSRARVVDELGAPTTITVLADEDLVVIYELHVNIPQNDFIGTAGAYSYTMRASNSSSTIANVGWNLFHNTSPPMFRRWGDAINGTSWLGTTTAVMSGCTLSPVTDLPTYSGSTPPGNPPVIFSTYTPGSHYVDVSATIPTGNGNRANINGLAPFLCPGRWQMVFSPAITKDNTQTLKFTFRISWSRA